jgi:predicted DNA-binding transcriptional regulator AlpA
MTRPLSPHIAGDRGHIASRDAALLDVRAVALICGCSTRHVYRLSDAGRLPAPVKLGALVRWRRRTGDPTTGIEDWLVAGCPNCRRRGR